MTRVTGTIPLDALPAGRELLQDAKNGIINLLLIYRLDRLGRSARNILNSVHELESDGVKNLFYDGAFRHRRSLWTSS
ncbi:recombinase family protein [Brevibacillus sp. Leaf182]|uniref:recombinase family protein n=1 Tax=Brevibacillus sp. Leaf182 TaxID=1736290 RepID=UPI001F542453|nr:recombinase family protein [Brevibacillus sp. Leaf182]